MHAWAEVCHLSQSSPHRLPMQYWLKNHWPDLVLFKHSLHTNCISNSAILRNNYILLLSDLCVCVLVKKKWCHKGSHSSSVSGLNRLVWLQTCKKVMGWCTSQWKMPMFCAKTIVKESCKFELACLKKKNGCVITAYKLAVLEILRNLHILRVRAIPTYRVYRLYDIYIFVSPCVGGSKKPHAL